MSKSNALPPVRAPEHLLLLALLIEIHGWGSKCPPVYCFLCHLTIWLSNMTWQEVDYCAHRATQAEVQAHLPKSLLHLVRLHGYHACLHLQRIDHLQQISAGLKNRNFRLPSLLSSTSKNICRHIQNLCRCSIY